MTVTLSICIPTYNRSECLKECLRSVLASVAGHEREIEIVVSDNASTDNTSDVIRAFQDMHSWIRYHRNDANIGGDRNIYTVAQMGSGQYIWVFGDDDKMEPEAVGYVLEKIRDGCELVVCNYSVWNRNFSDRKKIDGLRVGRDRLFEDRNTLLKCFNLHLGYISSVVIKKITFLKLPRVEYLEFIDYGFPFMFALYAGISQKCFVGYISSPIVCNRSNNSGNYDWNKYFVEGSSMIFDALVFKGYSKSSIRSAKHEVLKGFVLPNVIHTKLHADTDQVSSFRVIWKYYKKDWLFWFGYLFILLSPVFVVRFAKNAALMVRQVHSFISRDPKIA